MKARLLPDIPRLAKQQGPPYQLWRDSGLAVHGRRGRRPSNQVERAVPARLKRARSARSTLFSKVWKTALPVYSTLAAPEPPRYIQAVVNQASKN